MNSKWKLRYLNLAYHVSKWSKDPSTKVGCVLIDNDKHVVATGFNGFPPGVKDDEERYNDREVKYQLVTHAEANAILQAGHAARGTTAFCTLFPCHECTKLLITAGIKHIIVSRESNKRWPRHYAKLMLEEAGITWEEI